MYLGLFPDRAVASRLPCCSESLCQAANTIHLCLGSWKCGRADRESEAGGLLQGEGGLRPKRGFNEWPRKVVRVVLLHSCFNTMWFSHLLFLWTVEWDTGAYGFVSVLLSAQIVWQCYVKTVNGSFAHKLRPAHVISSLWLGLLMLYLACNCTVFILNLDFYAIYLFFPDIDTCSVFSSFSLERNVQSYLQTCLLKRRKTFTQIH